jgi:chromosomal replication initiation ATPase DnaA
MNDKEKIDLVLKEICRHYNLDFEILTNRGTGRRILRKPEYVRARWVFYKWVRDHTELTLQSIGEYFQSESKPVHYSTVIHGIFAFEGEISIYPKVARDYYALCQVFKEKIEHEE